MKLNFKIYSPFFIIISTLFILSCSKPKKEFLTQKALSSKDSLRLSDYQFKAENFLKAEKFSNAYIYYSKSKELQAVAKDSLGEGHSLICMAETQRASGDYFGCEESATEALPLLENLHYKEHISNQDNLLYIRLKKAYLSKAYNLLGMCHKKSNPLRAIEYYSMAKKVAKDSSAICIVENNIASVYIEDNNYNTAHKILSSLITSDTVLNNPKTKSLVLNNLGNVCRVLKTPEALKNLEEALNIRLSNNYLSETVSSYVQLAKFHENKNRQKSLLYAQKGLDLATRMGSTDKRLEALKVLISVSLNSQFYAIKYIKINDSLSDTRLKAKSAFASIKYDYKNEQAKALKAQANEAKSKLQIQKDSIYKLLMGIGTVAISVIFILLFTIYRLRHKKEKIQEAYKTENRISKKIHDELANDVFNIMSFAETMPVNNQESKERLLQGLDTVYLRTRDISRENSSINTRKNFGQTLKQMLGDFNTDGIRVIAVNADEIVWDEIEEHKKITLYRILQELMVNMKKHSRASLVVIKFIIKDKKVIVEYTDNGRGLTKENIFKNGIQNAETRILNINGRINFDSVPDKGLKVTIDFPI